MNYVIRCDNCRQQSIIEISEACRDGGDLLEEAVCPVCGAEGKDLRLISPVEDLLPSLEQIAKALSLGK